MIKKAVVLLSGGLDSAVTLYMARKDGYECHCLIFDYGQRHKKEIGQAKKIACAAGSDLKVVKLKFPWKGSSLVDTEQVMPMGRTVQEIKDADVPSTYVPGRNTIFLSIAASFAEAIGASAIFIGAHYEDSSGYPDCRKEYLEAFDRVIKLGTKAGIKNMLELKFPLIRKSKDQIIKTGISLGVPFELTWSCYSGGKTPCGQCDSCILRANGFKKAGMADPLVNYSDPLKAAITEVFSSIQGEGAYVGARQIFIRFRECNMKCGFCDTRDIGAGKEYSAAQLARKVMDLNKNKGPHHSISITGGEPLMYAEFLKKLLPALKELGFKIYLETNGTLPEKLREVIGLVDIVAMDFKLPSATKEKPYWTQHQEFLKIASGKKVFVKVVVTNETSKSDIEQAIDLIKKVDRRMPFIIQPATPVKKTDKAVSEDRLREFLDLTLTKNIKNPKIMPQMHKMWGVK